MCLQHLVANVCRCVLNTSLHLLRESSRVDIGMFCSKGPDCFGTRRNANELWACQFHLLRVLDVIHMFSDRPSF